MERMGEHHIERGSAPLQTTASCGGIYSATLIQMRSKLVYTLRVVVIFVHTLKDVLKLDYILRIIVNLSNTLIDVLKLNDTF
jgi:hypothetical protein